MATVPRSAYYLQKVERPNLTVQEVSAWREVKAEWKVTEYDRFDESIWKYEVIF